MEKMPGLCNTLLVVDLIEKLPLKFFVKSNVDGGKVEDRSSMRRWPASST
jgi:hypothetical protein